MGFSSLAQKRLPYKYIHSQFSTKGYIPKKASTAETTQAGQANPNKVCLVTHISPEIYTWPNQRASLTRLPKSPGTEILTDLFKVAKPYLSPRSPSASHLVSCILWAANLKNLEKKRPGITSSYDARAADHLPGPPGLLSMDNLPPPLLCPLASLAGTTHTTYLVANLSTTQLYLALFLGLIPLPALVQEHVVPVVRRSHLLPSFPTMATYATYGSLEC